MRKLSITQKYTLCALAKEVKQPFLFYHGKHAACIVVTSIIELINKGVVAKDEKDILSIAKPLPEDLCELKSLYDDIANSSPASLNKWLKDYIGGFSRKKIRPLIDDIILNLVDEEYLELQIDKGFLKSTLIYSTDVHLIDSIKRKIHTQLLQSNLITEETALLSTLLTYSGVLKNYFPREDVEKIKENMFELEKTSVGEFVLFVKKMVDEADSNLVLVGLIL